MQQNIIDDILKEYDNNKFMFEHFMNGVVSFFSLQPSLNRGDLPIIHSIKCRLKDPHHLREKILRKADKCITKDNFQEKITDLAGVRILHLYQDQFIHIHNEIKKQIDKGEWVFVEEPKAYTWDPEYKPYYETLNIKTELRETFYTSIHYLIKPNSKSNVCCEIQVRTLFEEIWGEIDHSINYPNSTTSIACKEQLRVLSKLVSTGTRLADSIFRSHEEYKRS